MLRTIIWLVAALMAMARGVASEPVPEDAPRYIIIVTGGELLTGAYADGHTHFLTRTLHPMGMVCVGSMCVDDRAEDITAALAFAAGRCKLVLVTGGLGPTDNDITREVLSQFTGNPLAEQPEVVAAMARRFNTTPEQLRSNLRRQCLVPTRGGHLANSTGTAVGLIFESPEIVIVALPGPPGELQPMVREQLSPYLQRRFGVRPPGPSITLRFVGLGQSQIDATIKEHLALDPDIITGSQFQGGRVDFTFCLPRDTPQSRARLAKLRSAIHERLDEYIYADDDTTLEQHVLGLLDARGQTLAIAETGSAGALTAALSAAPNAAVLRGALVGPTLDSLAAIDLRGDSAAPTAPGLAETLARTARTDWALVTGEVRGSADGRAVIPIALRDPSGRMQTHELPAPAAPAAYDRLTTQLLDHLRRRLKQAP
ncbi:MAG TPA: hypothetical protein ENN81_11395, partial [Phycisphaerales bacterium]|nr:hypothetical protein [Phycisphaerales bacterium]